MMAASSGLSPIFFRGDLHRPQLAAEAKELRQDNICTVHHRHRVRSRDVARGGHAEGGRK
jgi:hypothetical protein